MGTFSNINWKDSAEAFAKLISIEELEETVCNLLKKDYEEPVGVACSGGADSLSLLLLVYGHFPKIREKLHVLHFNHNIRGKESDEEEHFVENCAKALGISFHVAIGPENLEDRSEAHLREIRHAFFKKKMNELGGKMLLLGHHRDDVAETMLMRLSRGSGTGGLCAPRPISRFRDGLVHLRPLLDLGKPQLLEKLSMLKLPWCNDSSNEGEYYLRNRIRRRVIPEWREAVVNDFWKGIERSRSLLQEDDEALHVWLELLMKSKIQKGKELDLRSLSGMPQALHRRAMHEWLYLNGLEGVLNTSSFDILLGKILKTEPTRMSIGSKGFLRYANEMLVCEPLSEAAPTEWEPVKLEAGKRIHFPNGGMLNIEKISLTIELRNEILSGKVDPKMQAFLNADEGDLVLYATRWEAGDRYRPLGAPGSRKLQDMFTDGKIELSMRKQLPVIHEKNIGIVWSPGLPIADNMKLTNSSQYAFHLTYQIIDD